MTTFGFADDEPAPTRKPKRDDPEHRLSHHIAGTNGLLDRIMMGPCWFTAVDVEYTPVAKSAAARRIAIMRKAQLDKIQGIKPYHLDIYVWQDCTGRFGQFELKYGDKQPNIGQSQTMEALRRQNAATGCAWSVLEFYKLIRDAGFRLHGNAENIAKEIEARWRAADETVRGGAARPKRASRKRSPSGGLTARQRKAVAIYAGVGR